MLTRSRPFYAASTARVVPRNDLGEVAHELLARGIMTSEKIFTGQMFVTEKKDVQFMQVYA